MDKSRGFHTVDLRVCRSRQHRVQLQEPAPGLQEKAGLCQAAHRQRHIAPGDGLPGCHTQAKSIDELMQRVKEAIELYLEVQQELEPISEFVGIQKVTVSLPKVIA